MKLIIQIPCYNEELVLSRTLAELPAQLDGVDEIETLIIDDGSRDGTSSIARRLGVNHVVRHTRNRGLAAAFTTGLDACLRLGADVIVNTDADNQYPGKEIGRLVAPIVSGKADMVVGDRQTWLNPHFSPLKRVLQRLGSRTVAALAGRPIPDAVSGFRAFSREAALRLNIVTSFSYTVESILQASEKRLAIDFVPIETNGKLRESRLFRSIPQFILRSSLTMLRVYAMFRPLKVFASLSLLLLLVGTLPMARFLYLYAIGQGAGHVQSLVIGGVLFLTGGWLLALGIIADLIASNRRLLEDTLEKVRRLEAQQTTLDAGERPNRNLSQAGESPSFLGRPSRAKEVRNLRSAPVGMTLIELLVVIAIMGVLVALLFPAVQSARESARRLKCSSNLRQIGTAVLMHESTHRHLPTGGWGVHWAGLPDQGYAERQPGSWLFNALPYMEQQAVHDLGGSAADALTANGCPNRWRL